MKSYRQDPPFAVQIELAEGCQLRCSFCGLNGIRQPKENDFKFMKPETLRTALEEMVDLGWNPRIEFAMHGEPTMHPDFVGMIRTAREAAPKYQLMMTSNGGGLMRKPGPAVQVEQLFEAGLNVLALDDYEGVKFVDRIREELAKSVQLDANSILQIASFFDYPQDPKGSPHARRHKADRVVVYIQAIDTANKGNHSLLNNHAGAAAPLVDADHPSQSARCAKPFREMSIRWDGNVAVSCNDWRGIYKCGNVVRDGVEAVWNGERFDAARRKLILGERDFGPCKGCDAVSYRVGLLPDKFGKVTMPKPDKNTARIIAEATAGKPYTAPVQRPWEQPAKVLHPTRGGMRRAPVARRSAP